MKNEQYLAKQQELLAHYQQLKCTPDRPDLWRRFVFFAANCRVFLQLKALGTCQTLFKELLYHKAMSIWEDRHIGLLPQDAIKGWDKAWAKRVKQKPGIICTYHTGSYRLLNHMLGQLDMPLALLVSRAVKQRAEVDFLLRYGRPGTLEVLDAEDPAVLFQMRRALRHGVNILAYLDGNTGSGNGSIPVTFFGRNIGVRKGLATVAHWLQVPLYPVANRREGCALRFHFFPAIKPPYPKDRAVFAWQATQLLYQYLQEWLEADPAQWEGWLFLHHALLTDLPGVEPLPTCEVYGFDKERFLPFEVRGDGFVMDLETLCTHAVSKKNYIDYLKLF